MRLKILTILLIFLSTSEVIAQDNSEIRDQWGNINYDGTPWVENISKPYKISKGLNNRHLSIWASHGRYYDIAHNTWSWQRPNLFCTTEDLYTQTIVVPYLIPMLQNAGAIVFTPRERDWQKTEIIIDNDDKYSGNYTENSYINKWNNTSTKGFAYHDGLYADGENPFEAGTARECKTTSRKSNNNEISYQPSFTKEGNYAVYVSYQTVPNSISDAHYIVYHKGQQTSVNVNQQMGGGTWVYIGTFDFDKGFNKFNRVVLTNQSHDKGIVTADAVRFGGGMGNIERGGNCSGLPRCLEGARYYAQWAGMPYSVYSSKSGTDDYGDDINARSYMTNHLAGGSIYMPTLDGLKVPIELSLAIHSDAGYTNDMKSLIGSLAICTTDFNDGVFNSGVSRQMSKDFASQLLNGVVKDINYKYKKWNKRYLWDRNYSETRNPEIPSAILETLSHQNFPDMLLGQDPNFKFTLARSIYKTILRFVSSEHGYDYTVTPLTPDNFRISFKSKNKIHIQWNSVNDPSEETAKPTGFIVYTSIGNSGFDNGTYIKRDTYTDIKLEPDILYNFKVSAVNKGGESFPTEVLSACYHPEAKKTIIIVNGFHRLSSPAVRNNSTEQGFDLDNDCGVTYGKTAGWSGRQTNFDLTKIGILDSNGLGFSGDELAGKFIAGNDFNYVKVHADAIAPLKTYNLVSCSSHAIESGLVNIRGYAMADIILGLERNDGHSLEYYKTFKPSLQKAITEYLNNGGRLLTSGSYIGSDMQTPQDKRFINNMLHLKCDTTMYSNINDTITGIGNTFNIYRTINEDHYAATSPDVLSPISPAICAMQYADYQSACVAYKGNDYRCITLGFPFECIISSESRSAIMNGIIKYLIK